MATYLTITEAADELGVHKSTVSRKCAAHDVGRVFANGRLLTAGDINKLRRILESSQPGNPGQRGDDGRFC